MPENSIGVSVRFSFKGEDFHYTTVIDLEKLLRKYDEMPSIHGMLAQKYGIDSDSYLYEVMLAAEIEFSHPMGVALAYVDNDEFNLLALMKNWADAKALILLQLIAEKELAINDLSIHPALGRALLAAYHLGGKA